MKYEEQRMTFWREAFMRPNHLATLDFRVREADDALAEFEKRFAPKTEQKEENDPVDFSRCTYVLKNAGQVYPRTCAVCGLGPCKSGYPELTK